MKISDMMSEMFSLQGVGSHGDSSHGDSSHGVENLSSEKRRALENQVKRILREASTQSKMFGDRPGEMETLVDTILVPKVGWNKLVKKYLIQDIQRESSFHTTDKRMSYQEAIFPGMYTPNDGKLERLKVCIDTSGSIDDTRLAVFIAQLKQLIDKYKVNAELIFWDTEIESKGNFRNYEELKKIKVAGRGGTDPSCLFEYFDSRECRVKPSLVIVFTDGYFYLNNAEVSKWKNKYKNTLWIIEGRLPNDEVTMPFGKTTVFDD